jgi:putative membrane protein
VLLEIAYPLVSGTTRAVVVALTVVVGFLFVLANAGSKTAIGLVVVGGFAVEALGVATGFPFGDYSYSGALGPRLLGVPVVIPLAWAWMAYPAWLAAGRLSANRLIRVPLAAIGLAAWDLFLDPQMVAEHYWTWYDPSPALPGVPDVPISNYLGWLAVALILMAVVSTLDKPTPERRHDRPLLALYLWTYASSIVAHAVFLGRPASAAWGALGMGLVAIPLAGKLWTSR